MLVWSRARLAVSFQPVMICSRRGSPIIVLGRTCAGKSTLARHLERRLALPVIEISVVMDELARRLGLDAVAGLTGQDRAERVLQVLGDDAGGRWIVENGSLDRSVLILSLKTRGELEAIRRAAADTRVIWIAAPQSLRFERFINRAREPAMSFARFREFDARQARLGLLRSGPGLADVRIENDRDLRTYLERIDDAFERLFG